MRKIWIAGTMCGSNEDEIVPFVKQPVLSVIKRTEKDERLDPPGVLLRDSTKVERARPEVIAHNRLSIDCGRCNGVNHRNAV